MRNICFAILILGLTAWSLGDDEDVKKVETVSLGEMSQEEKEALFLITGEHVLLEGLTGDERLKLQLKRHQMQTSLEMVQIAGQYLIQQHQIVQAAE